MLSSHHYKSFKVSMIHRLRFTTDVQLGECVWDAGEEMACNFYVTWISKENLFPEEMLNNEI